MKGIEMLESGELPAEGSKGWEASPEHSGKENPLFDRAEVKQEFSQFCHYAGPPILSYALDTGVEIICLFFVGFIGERELAAAGLAFMLSNMTGHAVYTGFSTALGTLAAQAYGAEKYAVVGHVCQQSFIVVFTSLIPIVCLWICSGTIFEWSGVPAPIAHMAGQILQIQIMSLPPMALMQLIKVWMEAQGILKPITYISFLVCFSCGFFQWLFVHVNIFGIGVYGTPLAVTAAYTLGDIVFFATILHYKMHKKTWFGWSNHTWAGLWPFLSLSVMGAGMVCLEWWSYEILGIAGSAFGETATAVQTVLVNFAYFMYAVPEGIAIAASARVGHALGAGKPVAAKRAALLAMTLSFGSSLIMVAPLGLSNGTWANSFLQEEGSMLLVASCTPALMLFLVFNAGYGALSGILLGSGKQTIGFWANLVGCYLVGIPTGLFLSFKRGQGVLGLWWGMVLGIFILFSALSSYVLQLDWDQLVIQAQKSLEDDDDEELKSLNLADLEQSGAMYAAVDPEDRDALSGEEDLPRQSASPSLAPRDKSAGNALIAAAKSGGSAPEDLAAQKRL